MRLMSIEHAPLVPAASRFLVGSTPPPTVPVDAYRHGDVLILRCDLPGVDPDTIEVAINDRTLSVQAERSVGALPGDTVLLCERPSGAMYRSVSLPDDADPESALADFDGGVLTVTVPIVESITALCSDPLTMPPETESAREPGPPPPHVGVNAGLDDPFEELDVV